MSTERDERIELPRIPGVDPQVMLAGREASEEQRAQPEWLWHSQSYGSTAYGRWANSAEGSHAPYIRADLVAAALRPHAPAVAVPVELVELSRKAIPGLVEAQGFDAEHPNDGVCIVSSEFRGLIGGATLMPTEMAFDGEDAKPERAEANAAFMVGAWNFVRNLLDPLPPATRGDGVDLGDIPALVDLLADTAQGWNSQECVDLRKADLLTAVLALATRADPQAAEGDVAATASTQEGGDLHPTSHRHASKSTGAHIAPAGPSKGGPAANLIDALHQASLKEGSLLYQDGEAQAVAERKVAWAALEQALATRANPNMTEGDVQRAFDAGADSMYDTLAATPDTDATRAGGSEGVPVERVLKDPPYIDRTERYSGKSEAGHRAAAPCSSTGLGRRIAIAKTICATKPDLSQIRF